MILMFVVLLAANLAALAVSALHVCPNRQGRLVKTYKHYTG